MSDAPNKYEETKNLIFKKIPKWLWVIIILLGFAGGFILTYKNLKDGAGEILKDSKKMYKSYSTTNADNNKKKSTSVKIVTIKGHISDSRTDSPIDSAFVIFDGDIDTILVSKGGLVTIQLPVNKNPIIKYSVTKKGYNKWTSSFNIDSNIFFAKLSKQ